MAKEIDIRFHVKRKLKSDLKNIAANLGVPMSSLVKPLLQGLVDSYSEDMKQSPPKS